MVLEFIEQFLRTIASTDPIWVWLFFFLSNVTENVFPPWPGDTVTVFGGFLMAQAGQETAGFGWIGFLSSTGLGNLFGGLVMYFFGGKLMDWVKHKEYWFKKYIYDEEHIQKTLDWFSRNSKKVVILSRFSAGIRFFVSIVAGMVKMPLPIFLLFFGIANILWCTLLIGGGFYLGKNWHLILEILSLYNKVITAIIITIGVFYLFVRRKKKVS